MAYLSGDRDDLPPKGAVTVLFGCVAANLALPHIPVVKWLWWPLMLLSTLAHEMGHGVAAVLVGGGFRSFEMFADGSGVAHTMHSGRIAQAMVSAGGLVGPAIVACGLFFLARSERRARVAMAVLSGLLLLALVLVVRNLFGFAFVLLLAAGMLALVKWSTPWVARFALVFVAVQLALSVFSRGDYLFTPVARTGAGLMPSDVARMSDALWLPYWFWGGLCGLFSVAVLLAGLWLYLRPTTEDSAV